MAGRRMEPVDLLLIKGRSNHLTKDEIQRRREAELKAPTDNTKYPKYLPKDLRKDFTYYAKILVDLGIFSNLDVDNLARYLIQRHEYLKSVELMTDMSPLTVDGEKNEAYDTLRIQQNTFYTQCRQAASDLGLTVSSRLKLVVPKAPEKEEVNEFDKRFGNI